jgi:hypothetical protein
MYLEPMFRTLHVHSIYIVHTCSADKCSCVYKFVSTAAASSTHYGIHSTAALAIAACFDNIASE